jgi:hypothetical protein
MAAAVVTGTPPAEQAGSSGLERGSSGAEPAKNKPVAAPAPAKDAPAETDKPEADSKPKPKPTPTPATPADKREALIQRHARAMNAEAEKDGVAVNAPTEETRRKPGPKPGMRRAAPVEAAPTEAPAKPAPAPQANPTPEPEHDTDPAPPPEDDDGDASKAEPRSVHQLKAKARLRHGDADKALRLAFGDLKPEEFDSAKEALAKKLGVGSKQWADFRRYQAEERGKSKQLEHNAIELSQRLRAEFDPMIQARKAYQGGDYPKAFELAFGEDINKFQRKAIHQHLSQDPEKTRLQQQIDELRDELGKQRREPEGLSQSPEQQQRAALQREGDRTYDKLTQSDDPEIAHFAKRAAFIRRVVELRGEHYDPQTRTTLPLNVAADMVRGEIKRSVSQWRLEDPSGDGAQFSESPGLAGNEPARTSHRARSPNPSQAAQAGGSTRSMTREERIKAFASRM